MSAAEHSQDAGHDAGHHDAHGSIFKRIWVPFFILFGITSLEFLIAFTMGPSVGRVIIFFALTILKAYYIVAFFMHLKFERLTLGYSIVLPFIFILYLIALLLMEGGAVSDKMYG